MVMKCFKKAAAELLAVVIIVCVGASIALIIGNKNSKSIKDTNDAAQSTITQIEL